MSSRSETNLTPSRFSRDPFGLLRQMTSELDRVFDEPAWPSFRWPTFALATSRSGRLVSRDRCVREGQPSLHEDGSCRSEEGRREGGGGRRLSHDFRRAKAEAEEKKEQFYPLRARVRQLLSCRPAARGREAGDRQGDVCRWRARNQCSAAGGEGQPAVRKVEIQEASKAA